MSDIAHSCKRFAFYKTGDDLWSRVLDSDKKRGRATGENRNENAVVFTLSLAEGQAKGKE